VYFVLLWLGPYDYTLYSIDGALYLALAFFLLITTAWLFDRPYCKGELVTNYEMVISRKAEIFLVGVMVISFVAFALHMTYVVSLPVAGGYQFAGDDYRDLLSIDRPLYDKIAEIMMGMGVAAYLITARLRKQNLQYTKLLGIISLFLPAVAILAVGARSRVITTIGLFLIIYALNKRERGSTLRLSGARTLKVLIILCFGALLFSTLSLFATRGLENATNQWLIYPGDTTLKPIYRSIYEATGGGIGPLYKGSHYYTHSMPTFTWAFAHSVDGPKYWGAYFFYLEGYMLQLLGIPFPEYKEIASQSPVAGFYSTFITGYFLDWGITGTLFMIILTGVLFGRISYLSRKKQFSYFILPVILFMCWVAPIYYFWHMGWEYVLFWFIIIYPICRILGLKSEQRQS
jgi:hypothetical protein